MFRYEGRAQNKWENQEELNLFQIFFYFVKV